MSFTCAEQPGWSSSGWMLPTESFQYTTIATLFIFILECISIRRYSAAGLYTTMGRYWLLPSTAIEKSDIVFNKFELLPISVKMLLVLPIFVGSDVCVEIIGSSDEANIIEATGFHKAILDMS